GDDFLATSVEPTVGQVDEATAIGKAQCRPKGRAGVGQLDGQPCVLLGEKLSTNLLNLNPSLEAFGRQRLAEERPDGLAGGAGKAPGDGWVMEPMTRVIGVALEVFFAEALSNVCRPPIELVVVPRRLPARRCVTGIAVWSWQAKALTGNECIHLLIGG